MIRAEVDPELATIDITTIEATMHKTRAPLSPQNKRHVYGLLQEQSHLFFMTCMGMYRRTKDRPAFVKCGEGAGCLLRDYTRGVYALQVYNAKSSKLVCEESLRFEHVIVLGAYDLRFLIVLRDGSAIVLEFLHQSEVYNFHLTVDAIRLENARMREVKQNVHRELVVSWPFESIPMVPDLLTQSDVVVISDKSKRKIFKRDIGWPKDFVHVQHCDLTTFSVSNFSRMLTVPKQTDAMPFVSSGKPIRKSDIGAPRNFVHLNGVGTVVGALGSGNGNPKLEMPDISSVPIDRPVNASYGSIEFYEETRGDNINSDYDDCYDGELSIKYNTI